MTKEEIKYRLKTKGYCHFHISEFDKKYQEGLGKYIIGSDDSNYKKSMTGIRLDVINKELRHDIIISDFFDKNGESKMYKTDSFENAETVKNYIRGNYPKEDLFQIWYWSDDINMIVQDYYKLYFDKLARYFYDVEPNQQLKFNSQFTMYGKDCFLQNHRDGKTDGRLCVILIYLNEEYDESNGGVLILNTNEKVLPKFGNIAILDLGSFDIEHEVTEVIGEQNRYCVLSFVSLKNGE